MIKPEEVKPRNITVESIIYNDGFFSIAWGKWEDEKMHLAMRWNGDGADKNDVGYPKTFGYPVWFLIPDSLTDDILKGISGNEMANKEVMTKIKAYQKSNSYAF